MTPEIDVLDGGAPVADGGGPIDFGAAFVGGSALSKIFTVENNGAASLATSNLSVPASYSVTEPLDAAIPAGNQDTFTVQLSTAAEGTFAGAISFNNDDGDENPYDFTVTGTILAPPAPPSIDSQPVADNPNPVPGQTAVISASVSGATTLQWQVDKGAGFMDLANGGNISGANTDTLTVSNVTDADTGAYRLVATNANGSVTSNEASIFVAGTVISVPTLTEWGRIILLLMLFAAGAVILTRRKALRP